MKKLLALLLGMSILLGGCARPAEPNPTTSTTTTAAPTIPEPPVVEPEEPTEKDFGIFLPESEVEQATDGAVKVYALPDWGYETLMPMGEGLLFLSGIRESVLTYIDPDGTTASVTLRNQLLFPGNLTLIQEQNCVAYYDSDIGAVLLRDTQMKEKARISMPETMVGTPLVTSDWSRIYYLTDNQLRYLDIETGIDRLLKEMSFAAQSLETLYFDDSLMECWVYDGDYYQSMLISTQTGELVYVSENLLSMSTSSERFFASYYQGDIEQHIFGTRQGEYQTLNTEDFVYLRSAELWAAVTCGEGETSLTLSYYDLTTGHRYAAVELTITDSIQCLAADAQRETIWFIGMNEDLESKLYCWDYSQSETGDTTCYTAPYYTELDPDLEGLEQAAEYAREIGRKYGVQVRIYEEALLVQPSDYEFELEYMIPVYDRYLSLLDTALGRYPEGFLRKLGSTSHNGKLTISLIRGAYGDNGLGSLDSADGVHFYDNRNNVYIGLVMGSNFEGTLYHELFHAIDTYVMSRSNLYDFWEDLNPPGFEYDNDYVSNQFREDYQYLEDDRWFIDMYSMSYAKEDRARIMEYAMQAGNEDYFASEHMQAKLAALSKGIRTAFGLKNTSTILPWEQYLH